MTSQFKPASSVGASIGDLERPGEDITPLRSETLEEVVHVHTAAFPSFFLSELGPGFLREFYASFLVDPVGLAFVARNLEGEVLGVVAGPLDPRGYFKRLLIRRWWAFCLASVPALLQRPACAPRLLRAVLYRGETPSGPTRALLSSIAVNPEAQGKGIGKRLVTRWLEAAHKRQASGCFLTTDAEGNDAVNAFYRNLGWKLERTYLTPEARKMNRYIYDF